MKILVVSNLYPPYFMGGYEIACKTVVDELQERGHHVCVLTSTWQLRCKTHEGSTWRVLNYFPRVKWRSLVKIFFAERHDWAETKKILDYCQPDCVFVWNFAGLSRSVLHLLREYSETIIYNVFDYWMVGAFQSECLFHLFDEKTGTIPVGSYRIPARLFKSALRTFFSACGIDGTQPDLSSGGKFIFNSDAILRFCREKGLNPYDYRVIRGGISKKEFPLSSGKNRAYPGKLLYVGRIVPEKGVHTAIEALLTLVKDTTIDNLTLTIVGEGDASYIAHLKKLTKDAQLTSCVTFKGTVQRSSIRDEYLSHDILIFPSIWEEPLGLVILEAMACGVAVVGTGTGGSAEILKDEFNCLLFPPGSSETCAQQIEKLISDPHLLTQIREGGRKTVSEGFYLENKVDEVEKYITNTP